MIKENDKKDVIIIDFKLGNLFSVKHACIHVGLNPIITSDKHLISNAKAVILPGVGAFSNAMNNLEKLDLILPIKDLVNRGVPLLGICLGLQLLFEESEEFGSYRGLGIVKGLVKKFPCIINENKIKVPNIGWNSIYHHENERWENTPLMGLKQNSYMYFVHSYYVVPEKINEILSFTDYAGVQYCSSLIKDNIFAAQFHPEKSAESGLDIYRKWAQFINN